MDIIAELEKEQARENPLPELRAGDSVRVHYRVREGQRERIQVFEGTVLQIKGGKSGRRAFTVRRVSGGTGVERIFPMDSPRIEDVEITRRGSARRARLYYLRERVGKRAKVREQQRPVDEGQAEEKRAARKARRADRREAAKAKRERKRQGKPAEDTQKAETTAPAEATAPTESAPPTDEATSEE